MMHYYLFWSDVDHAGLDFPGCEELQLQLKKQLCFLSNINSEPHLSAYCF